MKLALSEDKTGTSFRAYFMDSNKASTGLLNFYRLYLPLRTLAKLISPTASYNRKMCIVRRRNTSVTHVARLFRREISPWKNSRRKILEVTSIRRFIEKGCSNTFPKFLFVQWQRSKIRSYTYRECTLFNIFTCLFGWCYRTEVEVGKELFFFFSFFFLRTVDLIKAELCFKYFDLPLSLVFPVFIVQVDEKC